MDRARVETMYVILVCTETFAQLALDRTEAGIALMKGMIDVTSNEYERKGYYRKEKGYLAIRHVPGHEYTPPSTSCTSERSHGYKESIASEWTCTKAQVVSRDSPSHKREREPRTDAPRRCDQSPVSRQSQITLE